MKKSFYRCRHFGEQDVPFLETFAWLSSSQAHGAEDDAIVDAYDDMTPFGGGMVPLRVRLGDLEILEEA